MTVSIVECPKCYNRFNYEFSNSNAWGAIYLGPDRSIFKCPVCKQLGSFNTSNRGRDPALPTTNDMVAGIGGRVWGLLLGPILVLIVVGVVLGITLTSSPYQQLFLVPILGGVVWEVAYIYHLNRRLGASVGSQPAKLRYYSKTRSLGGPVFLGVGIIFMLLGVGSWAMDYYSFCPPGANCGTGSPIENLAIALVNFSIGLALVVGSVLHPSRRILPTQQA